MQGLWQSISFVDYIALNIYYLITNLPVGTLYYWVLIKEKLKIFAICTSTVQVQYVHDLGSGIKSASHHQTNHPSHLASLQPNFLVISFTYPSNLPKLGLFHTYCGRCPPSKAAIWNHFLGALLSCGTTGASP